MERIVFGLSKINFESNCEDVLTENRPPNFCSTTGDSTEASGTPLSLISNCPTRPTRSLTFSAMSHVNATTINTATAATATSPAGTANPPSDQLDSKPIFDFSEAPEEDDDEEKDGDCLTSTSRSRSKTIACFSQRRKMPARASKENSLLKIKRRSIMKPTKKTTEVSSVSSLRPSDIKKIYMTKSLGKFRSTNLETIFEEPQQEKRVASKNRSSSSMNDSSDQIRFTGMKKLRRSLSCSDGLNVNKTLIKQRRAKIKKTFGKRFALKKIALDDFLEHLNKSIVERDEETIPAVAELVSDTAFVAEEASAMDE